MLRDGGLAPLLPSCTGERRDRERYYNGFLLIIKPMFLCAPLMIAVDNFNFLV